MANELQIAEVDGLTFYAVLVSSMGSYYRSDHATFEAFNAANWLLYARGMVENGTTGIFFATMPTVAADLYHVYYYLQLGAGPATTDILSDEQFINWNGTAVVSVTDTPPNSAPATPLIYAPVRATNNLILYYAPLSTVGNYGSNDAAIHIFSRFDIVVFKMPGGGDLSNTYRIIEGARRLNANVKFYGYTNLGGAANYATWLATMQAWDGGSFDATSLDGIFIDQFGQGDGIGTATRVNQNTAILAVHQQGSHNWPVFVNAADLATLFEANPSEAASLFGNDVLSLTITDLFLLESYWQSNTAAMLEDERHRLARARYSQAVLATGSGLRATPCALVGTGGASTLLYDIWDAARQEIAAYGIRMLGVGNADYSAAGHTYFSTNETNIL